MSIPTLTPEASRYLDRCGVHAERDHLPRIAGRLWARLMLAEEPISFDELSFELKVSRGAISANTRLLESIGAIERIARPGDRRDFFRISEPPGRQYLESRMHRLQDAQQALRDLVETEEGLGPEASRRFSEMDRFYSATLDALAQAIRRLHP